MGKLAIVAVETNLVGRRVVPPAAIEIGTSWPFQNTTGYTEESAEIVATFIGDLDDGGAFKVLLRGQKSGLVKEAYAHAFRVEEG